MTDYTSDLTAEERAEIMRRARERQAAMNRVVRDASASPDDEQHQGDDRNDQEQRPQHDPTTTTKDSPTTMSPGTKRHRQHYTEEFMDSVVAAYRAGQTVTDIAKATGVSYFTLYNWIRKAGINLKEPRLQPEPLPTSMAYMSDTTSTPYSFPQTNPHPTNFGNQARSPGLLDAFLAHLRAHPGEWFELGEIKTGGVGISNGKGYTFTVRSKDPDGNRYRAANGKDGVKVWGRFDPPAEQPQA